MRTTTDMTQAIRITQAIIKIEHSSIPLEEEEEEKEEKEEEEEEEDGTRREGLGVWVAWCLLLNGCKYACVCVRERLRERARARTHARLCVCIHV